jgi:hypothetical protein
MSRFLGGWGRNISSGTVQLEPAVTRDATTASGVTRTDPASFFHSLRYPVRVQLQQNGADLHVKTWQTFASMLWPESGLLPGSSALNLNLSLRYA